MIESSVPDRPEGCGAFMGYRICWPVHPAQKQTSSYIMCGQDRGAGIFYLCFHCAADPEAHPT